jgi:anti-sigma regulatory factor (Ser/Thr protein kinase)
MKKDKIILSIPCQLKFAETVEKFVLALEPLLRKPLSRDALFELKLVLSEAFVNVVHHSSHDIAQPVEISFEIDQGDLKICLRDRGKGLPIGKCFPPYPEELVGTSHVLLKTMDGVVNALVEDRVTLRLTFKENNFNEVSSEDLFEKAQEGGTGISLMTKLMDVVRFKFLVKEGNYLQLIKRLER